MKIIVTADDGREFKGINYQSIIDECNAYEANLRLKKEKEEAEQKAKDKKEKELAQQIKEYVNSLNDLTKEYELLTGEIVGYDRSSKDIVPLTTKSSGNYFTWVALL